MNKNEGASCITTHPLLFSECPMGCNEFCTLNFGIRFTYITMPPVTFNEKGEIKIADYNRTTACQETTELASLTHFRVLTILRNAKHQKPREAPKRGHKGLRNLLRVREDDSQQQDKKQILPHLFLRRTSRRSSISNSNPDEKALHRQHTGTGLFHQRSTVSMPQEKRGFDEAHKELGTDPENTLLVDI